MGGLLWLLLVFALSSYLANGQQGFACTNRYLTINTYGNLTAVNITCFGVTGDCEVFYSNPGEGCTGVSLLPLATIPPGETKLTKSSIPYGALLCSNYQISVQLWSDYTVYAQLPRATQTGKMFHTRFSYHDKPRIYRCGVSALATPAMVNFYLDPTDEGLHRLVDKYQTEDFLFDVTKIYTKTIKIVSNASVVVSCREITKGVDKSILVVLEPISSEPQLVVTGYGGYYSLAISNCSTNELITNSSHLIRLDARWTQNGLHDCKTKEVANSVNLFYTTNFCVTLVAPIDNETCVSVLAYESNFEIADVGLPKSKLTTQLVNYPYQSVQFYFAFTEGTCSFTKGNKTNEVKLSWLAADLENNVAGAFEEPGLDANDFVECSTPVYVLFFGKYLISFRSGNQSDLMWTPFFQSEGCQRLPPIQPSKAMRLDSIKPLLAFCWYLVIRS